MCTCRAKIISYCLSLLTIFGYSLLTIRPAQAQVFAPIPALSFVKPFAGADPLPQVITVGSVGAAFNFTYAASTSSGGSWLSVDNVSWNNCSLCGTPATLNVIVTTLPTLAVGSYSGQVTVTSQSGTVAMIIPVTLTVANTLSAFFDNLPGQVSFSMKTSGTAITSQDLQVRNAGAGSLGWTLTKSTSDGGNWLAVSSTNGTSPSTVTASITVANLPGGGATPGSFIGQLVFQNVNGNVTVPVVVVVGANILSQINAISFNKVFGGANPLPQTLTIPSTGTAFNFTRSWSTATGGSWLSVSNASWNNCVLCGTPGAITVTVAPSPTLAVGTYTGQVVITTQTDSMSITIPVILTIAPGGGTYFDNVPGQMSFSLKTSGTSITSQPLEIRNAGSGTLSWTIAGSTSDAGNWLTISSPSGVAPSLVNIGVTVANLPNGGLIAGTFVGQVVIHSAGGDVSVPISVVVGANVFTQVNAINFTKVFGGPNPLPQTVTIAGTGAGFNFTAAAFTATGGSWLSVDNVSWNNCVLCGTPGTITAIVNASPTLAVGTYTGQIVLTSQVDDMAMTVPVTLTVAPAGGTYFDDLPGQLSFSLKTGSSTNPPSQTVQVRNGGSGSLGWTLTASTSDGANWLSASLVSGTAPSNVIVSVTTANLPGLGLLAGTFVGELVFRTAAGDSTSISVVVVVGANVFNQINPLHFTKVFGGANPLPQTLTVASTGSAINFTTSSATSTGGSWLTIDNRSWNNCVLCGNPQTITALVNASPTLAVGTYTGQIVFTAQAGNMAITVPVTLTVAPAAGTYFDNIPGQMSFSLLAGGGTPATLDIQIRNAGYGTLGWTVAKNTSDGGDWLTVSAPSGTAPSTLTAGVNLANLPGLGLIAGTFTGEIILQSAGGNVSIPVSVTVGSSVFTQLAPLSFTKAFGGANPLAQVLNLTSLGTNFNFTFVGDTGNGTPWLSVVSAGACVLCATPKSLTASITAATPIPAGIYTGQIVATEQAGTKAMTIPVSFTVSVSLSAPVLIAPSNGATGVPLAQKLSWNASANALTYDVYFGTVNPPPLVTSMSGTTYDPGANGELRSGFIPDRGERSPTNIRSSRFRFGGPSVI